MYLNAIVCNKFSMADAIEARLAAQLYKLKR